MPGFKFRLCSNSYVLLTHIQGGNRRWSKHLAPCPVKECVSAPGSGLAHPSCCRYLKSESEDGRSHLSVCLSNKSNFKNLSMERGKISGIAPLHYYPAMTLLQSFNKVLIGRVMLIRMYIHLSYSQKQNISNQHTLSVPFLQKICFPVF